MARVKMVGNIIELNKPITKMLHIAVIPLPVITKSNRAQTIRAKIPKVAPGFFLPTKKAMIFANTTPINMKAE